MKKHIKKNFEKLKKRPIHERKKMATVFAIIVTVLILIVSLALGSLSKTKKTPNNNSGEKFEQVFNKIGNQFSEIGEQFNEQKESFNLVSEEIKKQEETSEIKTESETELTKTSN